MNQTVGITMYHDDRLLATFLLFLLTLGMLAEALNIPSANNVVSVALMSICLFVKAGIQNSMR